MIKKEENFDIRESLKQIPLDIRLKVAIQAYFIDKMGGTILIPLDENGNDIPEVVELNNKILEHAKPIIDLVLEEYENWKLDGFPQ